MFLFALQFTLLLSLYLQVFSSPSSHLQINQYYPSYCTFHVATISSQVLSWSERFIAENTDATIFLLSLGKNLSNLKPNIKYSEQCALTNFVMFEPQKFLKPGELYHLVDSVQHMHRSQGFSTLILVSYGYISFSSEFGRLAGNVFVHHVHKSSVVYPLAYLCYSCGAFVTITVENRRHFFPVVKQKLVLKQIRIEIMLSYMNYINEIQAGDFSCYRNLWRLTEQDASKLSLCSASYSVVELLGQSHNFSIGKQIVKPDNFIGDSVHGKIFVQQNFDTYVPS